MDIINKLHSCFREMQYFEFGEDYVKFYEDGKVYIVTIKEVPKQPEKTILKGVQSTIKQKPTKGTRKTWESILKAKSK